MAVRKGAKKTVGKARRGDSERHVMRLYYVRKPNGAYARRYERVPVEEEEEGEEDAAR